MKFKMLLSLFAFLVVLSSHAMDKSQAQEDLPIGDQEQLNSAVLEEFEKIVAEYHARIDAVNRSSSSNELFELAKNGYWYATDYYSLLSRDELKGKSSILARLAWLQNKGSFSFGVTTTKDLVLGSTVHGDLLNVYKLAKDKKASDVVRTLGENGVTLIDCGIAYQLAFYRAALRLLGPDQFDRIFSTASDKPLFATRSQNTRLAPFFTFLDEPLSSPPQGSVSGIAGHPFYQYKNLYGEGRTFNVMVKGLNALGAPVYIGLGLGTEGSTKEQVEADLVRLFNKDSLDEKMVSPQVWRGRPTAISPFNTMLLNFLKDKRVANVNDQSMKEDLTACARSIFGSAADSALEGLWRKFPGPSYPYFVLDYGKLLKASLQ